METKKLLLYGRDTLVGYTDTSGVVHNVYDAEGGTNISETLRKSRVNSSQVKLVALPHRQRPKKRVHYL